MSIGDRRGGSVVDNDPVERVVVAILLLSLDLFFDFPEGPARLADPFPVAKDFGPTLLLSNSLFEGFKHALRSGDVLIHNFCKQTNVSTKQT